jgi:hypothetical protein
VLSNRFDQVIHQALTNEQGRFSFNALSPDLYTVHVTLASFVPAIRRNIAVAAGSESILEISMASVLSTVELTSTPPRGTLMTDDWKWVLRTSHATRPVLRFLPKDPSSSVSRSMATIFSDTTGVLKVSAGDAESLGGAGVNQQDLGTAFALATSIMGSARVQFSGNLSYLGGLPAAGFRTSYARTNDDGSSPEITLTVRQLSVPTRDGLPGLADTSPALRTMALGALDTLTLFDDVHLEYGFKLESVAFLSRLNYMSPFARATYDLGDGASVRLAFSSGTEPAELVAHGEGPQSDLNQDLAALALLPRVSLRDGQTNVERTENFEIGYQKIAGSRTYSAGAYREDVSNAAFTMSAPQGFVPIADALPQLGSNSTVFDAGNYRRVGYNAAVDQSFGDVLDASLAAGRTGALVADEGLSTLRDSAGADSSHAAFLGDRAHIGCASGFRDASIHKLWLD